MDDDTIVRIINKLPCKLLENYSDWLKVLSVMKRHNKFDIWDKWCKKSDKYKYERNI